MIKDDEILLKHVREKLIIVTEDISEMFKILQEVTDFKCEAPALINYEQWENLHEKNKNFFENKDTEARNDMIHELLRENLDLSVQIIRKKNNELLLKEVSEKIIVIGNDISTIFKIVGRISNLKIKTPILLDYQQWEKIYEKKTKLASRIEVYQKSFSPSQKNPLPG